MRPAVEDIQRTKELLEIWKDHVRTLTRERDEAYQEIDRLKSSKPAQFGAVETQLLPDTRSQQVIANLQDQVQRLSVENQNAQKAIQAAGNNAVDRDKLKQLESQTKALEDELIRLRRDREAFMKTHAEMGLSYQNAMKEVETTRQENRQFREENEKIRSREAGFQEQLQKMKTELDAFRAQKGDLESQNRLLQADVQNLRNWKEKQRGQLESLLRSSVES